VNAKFWISQHTARRLSLGYPRPSRIILNLPFPRVVKGGFAKSFGDAPRRWASSSFIEDAAKLHNLTSAKRRMFIQHIFLDGYFLNRPKQYRRRPQVVRLCAQDHDLAQGRIAQ
jgi:hypothetical protein